MDNEAKKKKTPTPLKPKKRCCIFVVFLIFATIATVAYLGYEKTQQLEGDLSILSKTQAQIGTNIANIEATQRKTAQQDKTPELTTPTLTLTLTQLIQMAEAHLVVDQNTAAANAYLHLAVSFIEQANTSQLAPLVDLINEKIEQLNNIEPVNNFAQITQLQTIEKQLASLSGKSTPINNPIPETNADLPTKYWEKTKYQLKHAFEQAVTVKRITPQTLATTTITPDILQAKLQLRLLGIQSALLVKNNERFHQAIEMLQADLSEKIEDSVTKTQITEMLEALNTLNLNPVLPTLSELLPLIRTLPRE